MRWNVGMALLSVALMALAGCSGKDKDDGDDGPTSTSSATTTGTSGPAANVTNQPPIGTMGVAVNGTSATFNLTGQDPDGDALTWNLTFGDGFSANGTQLPATVAHAFTAAGNYTANFTVSDGNASKSYSAAIAIAAVGSGGQAVTFTGSIVSPDPFAVAPGGSCIMPLADFGGTGTWGGVHRLPAEVLATWDFGATPASVWVTFISDDGGTIGGNGNSGKVGEGVSQALVCGTEPMTDYTVNLFPA